MGRVEIIERLKELEDLFREAYIKESPIHIEYNDIEEILDMADSLEFAIGDMESMQDVMDVLKFVSED